MVDFMQWALTDGQKFCAELGYAPLPASVVKMETGPPSARSSSDRGVSMTDARPEPTSASTWASGSGRAPFAVRASCLILVGDRRSC